MAICFPHLKAAAINSLELRLSEAPQKVLKSYHFWLTPSYHTYAQIHCMVNWEIWGNSVLWYNFSSASVSSKKHGEIEKEFPTVFAKDLLILQIEELIQIWRDI